MVNKFQTLFFLLVSTFISNGVIGQGNPGFMGKKIAFGYNSQFCLLKTLQIYRATDTYFQTPNDKVSMRNILTNHDWYLEYATSKYRSLSAHLSYQKIPLTRNYFHSEWSDRIAQQYTLNGQDYLVNITKIGGVANCRMINLGLKYSFFLKDKTVSSPLGASYYMRMDLNINKITSNKFIYEIDQYWQNPLTQEQLDYASKNLVPNIEDTDSKNLSIGFGAENKVSLTKSVYFRVNAEMNLSTVGFRDISEAFSSNYTDRISINEDLKNYGFGANRFRNIFLVGFGLGVLL